MVSDIKKNKRKIFVTETENVQVPEPVDSGHNSVDEDEDAYNLSDIAIANEDDSSDDDIDSDFEESNLEVEEYSSEEEEGKNGDFEDSGEDQDADNSENEESDTSEIDDGNSDDDDDEKEKSEVDDDETEDDNDGNDSVSLENKQTEEDIAVEVNFQSKHKSPKSIKAEDSQLESEKNKQNLSDNKVNITKRKKDKKNIVKDSKSYEDPLNDEYADGDTSDEEDIRNTIGNVPVNWYDEYKHLGYDWEGKKILKPDHGDQLDYFLRRMEDPNFWRTVRDPQTGQDVVLSDADVNLIQRLESQKIPDEAYNEYAPWIEWFTSEVMKMPLRKFPEHKRSFLPSLNEKRKVAKLVHALKMGWIKPTKKLKKERMRKLKAGPQFYMLWQSDDVAEEMRRIHKHIPAPKRQLPGHAESYNPPAEYLFTEKEMEKFEETKRSIGNKKLHFVPKKYSSLRQVPAYDRFIKERFTRCLDLYLCPRAVKMKLMIEPEDLLPKLPSPKDLQPFPTTQSLIFKGHTDMIRTMSMDPIGQYLVSGSDDKTVKFWEISTGRCLKTIKLDGVVRCVRWCPSSALSLVAVACDEKCYIINPGLGDSLVTAKTNDVLEEAPPQEGLVHERVRTAVQWHWKKDNEDLPENVLIMINHFKEIKQIAWHGRGDYFATVMPDGANRSVIIHQLSKGRSQIPFSKSKGLIQCVIFHPVRPFFFVATQKNVRIYDLVKQEMVKKLYSNCKWISNIAIHPGGDNLLISSYDSKVVWFDLDLSTKPYKVLRLHNSAVRSVAYHKRYPLFASVSDDCSLIISHGMVYNDLLQNALIVPLKRLSNHKTDDDYGIFDVMFHHFQPWVFTCGADRTIRLYS